MAAGFSEAQALSVAGLFAGIGGIELGLQQAGHRSELICEIDEGASRVLSARFPDVALVRDVRELKRLPAVDLVAAGFPCQDLSQAGRTAGIRGVNSGLVGHVFRLLDSRKKSPRWLLLENVSFMLQLDRGRGMRYLVDELESRGYAWAYRVVDTQAFGLPQRRQRVVLLASQTDDPRTILFADDAPQSTLTFRRDLWCGFYWTEGLRGLGWAVDAVPTLKGGSTIGIPSPPAVWDPAGDAIFTPGIADAERLQGFLPGWTEPALTKGVRPGHRWKLVGNAVSVPVAAWVGRRLSTPGGYDDARTQEVVRAGVSWPRAACGGPKQNPRRVEVSMWPVAVSRPHLSEFLSHNATPLSYRATAGFLSRAKTGSLKFERGFLDAVSRHVERMKRAAAA